MSYCRQVLDFVSNKSIMTFKEDGQTEWKEWKENYIIDVGQDDSHDDVQLKEAPLKWFGKIWLDFLSN